VLQKQRLLTLVKYELAYTDAVAELGSELLQAAIEASTYNVYTANKALNQVYI
jgi:hypothetical protein